MNQGEETRALDRHIQLALIFCFGASDAGRNDLAVFIDKFFQDADVFVIDLDNFFGREAAEFLATKQTAIGVTLVFLVLVELSTFTGGWTGHDLPLAKFELGYVQNWHRTETVLATQKTLDGNGVAFLHAVHFCCQLTKRHGVHFDFYGNVGFAFALRRLVIQRQIQRCDAARCRPERVARCDNSFKYDLVLGQLVVSTVAHEATMGFKRRPLLSRLPGAHPWVLLSRRRARRPIWIFLPSSSVTGRFQPHVSAR